MTETYERVNSAFKETFSLIFGECNLELNDLKDYFQLYHYQLPVMRVSTVSGKPVVLSSSRYPESSRFISQDEIDYAKRPKPFSINEIKDIDSIMSAFGERFSYAGNKSFGECECIEDSDNISDSFNVLHSHTIVSSKNVAYSSFVRDGCENIFGSSVFLRSKYLIKVIGADNLSRSFEAYVSTNSSDLFFSLYCQYCADCMFSFNLRSKRHCIGNMELAQDRYRALKKKLVDESRLYLEKHKSFPSIFAYSSPPKKELLARVKASRTLPEKPRLKSVEAAFSTATGVILGKPLSPVSAYRDFLMPHVDPVVKVKTPFGNEAYYCPYFWQKNAPKTRMITNEEGNEAAKLSIKLAEGESPSLKEMLARISDIAFYPVQFKEGPNEDIFESSTTYHSSNCFNMNDATFSKNCAYDMHMQNCEAVFGCGTFLKQSKYCIRCYDSVGLTACMDVDCSNSCSNCLFCHNCENLENCMFCFNAKSLRYAIGNVEYLKEEYMKMRAIVQKQLLSELDRTGTIGIDICSLKVKK